MEIRRFLIQDRHDLKTHIPQLQIMCDYFTPFSSWMEKQIETASDVLYAVKDDMVLGYVIADKKKKHLQIELICVGKEGRSMKGIGTALMKECETIAKEYSLPEIQLDAQERAVGFYEKLGYTEVKRSKKEVIMKKTL